MGGCLGRARRSDDADRANKMGSNNATSPAPAAAGGPATRFGFASDFAACFDLGKELGAGQFGTTFACAPKPNGRWDAQGPPDGSAPPASGYAVKVIPKRILTSKEAIEDVKKEVSIMRTLAGASENIVRLYEAFEDSKAVYLVMEKCNGGELFDRIIAKGHFSEADAAKIVRQMLQVVAQCHLNGVMHRDLKPENFLYACKEGEEAACKEGASVRFDRGPVLKATDFGLSEYFVDKQVFTDVVGSAYYVAPDVLQRRYGPPADIWSIGVIMYILLCGQPPFWAPTEAGIFNEVLKATPNFSNAPWSTKISQSAKTVLKAMLTRDPRQRITAAQALAMPWVRVDGDAPDVPLDHTVLSSMAHFTKFGKLKQLILKDIASTFDEDELRDLRDQFLIMDENGDGNITLDEMMRATNKMRTGDGGKAVFADNAEVMSMLHAIDADGDGRIDYMEFVAATMRLNQIQRGEQREGWKRRVKHVFDSWDKDGNGFIDRKEVASMFGLDENDANVDKLIAEADRNGDGLLDYREFLELLRQDARKNKAIAATGAMSGSSGGEASV